MGRRERPLRTACGSSSAGTALQPSNPGRHLCCATWELLLSLSQAPCRRLLSGGAAGVGPSSSKQASAGQGVAALLLLAMHRVAGGWQRPAAAQQPAHLHTRGASCTACLALTSDVCRRTVSSAASTRQLGIQLPPLHAAHASERRPSQRRLASL